MSRHVVVSETREYVFGWDQPLQTYFLQVHDPNRPEEERIVAWLGGKPYEIYEVEDLARQARRYGLVLDHEMRVKLYGEMDDGR